MKVHEVIAELSKLDPELDVACDRNCGVCDVKSIYVREYVDDKTTGRMARFVVVES